MKKALSIIVAAGALLTFAACGSKSSEDSSSKASSSKAESAANGQFAGSSEEGGRSAENDFKLEKRDGGVVFRVSSDFELKEDAWLGIVPAGVDYVKEVDADEVDVYYAYPSTGEEFKGDGYFFVFDGYQDLEDGSYGMVLCDTDDETGKVLAQFDVKKAGDSLTPDFSTARYNLK